MTDVGTNALLTSVIRHPSSDGAIAQLGERLLCKQEVVGSIPSGSTRRLPAHKSSFVRTQSARSRLFCLLKDGCRRARMVSDIVKRRSIRVLRVAVKPRAARYLHSGIRKQGSGIRQVLMPDV